MTGPVRSARSRSGARWLALAGAGALLLVWGLWASGVFTGPVPLPATQTNAPVDAGDWAMAGRDAAHTAVLPSHGGFAGEELWRFETQQPLPAAPAVSNGQLFLGTGDNRLVAMDSASGDVLWERQLSSVTVTTPAVTPGAVYVTVRDGLLLAMDRHTGAELWGFQADSALFASPTVYRGAVYAGSWNGTLYAVDAENGRRLWTFPADGSIVAPPAFQDDLMALATDDGLVYLIDLLTGRKRLVFDTVNALAGSPVFDGGRLLVGTGRGRLAAIDWTKLEYPFERGLRSWRRQFFIWGLQPEPPLPQGTGLGPGPLPRQRPERPCRPRRRRVRRQQGREAPRAVGRRRKHAVGVRHRSPRTRCSRSGGRRVYLGNDAGEVHVVDRVTGAPVQIIRTGVALSGQTVVTEGGLYVTSGEAGTLIALR